MAAPVGLADTLAITELVAVTRGCLHHLGGAADRQGGSGGRAVVPVPDRSVLRLTIGGGSWRGPADLIAVGFYRVGGVPLVGIVCCGSLIVNVLPVPSPALCAVTSPCWLWTRARAMVSPSPLPPESDWREVSSRWKPHRRQIRFVLDHQDP
jgi:hypothetical protein